MALNRSRDGANSLDYDWETLLTTTRKERALLHSVCAALYRRARAPAVYSPSRPVKDA